MDSNTHERPKRPPPKSPFLNLSCALTASHKSRVRLFTPPPARARPFECVCEHSLFLTTHRRRRCRRLRLRRPGQGVGLGLDELGDGTLASNGFAPSSGLPASYGEMKQLLIGQRVPGHRTSKMKRGEMPRTAPHVTLK